MKAVGQWVKAHGKAIYGTRGGDFSQEGRFTSTQKSNTTHLFVLDDTLEQITLKSAERNVLTVKNESGQAIDFKQVGGDIRLTLLKTDGSFPRVYTLSF